LLWITDATDDELVGLYCKARSLVFCSSAEGYGLPLVEARQLGCRVIASDIPVFRELADVGVTFFPAHNVDALARAIQRAVGSESGQVAQREPWTWADSTNQLLSVFVRMLGDHADEHALTETSDKTREQ
jgi:alpha-1,2-rhamnosyltransferase